MTYACPVQASCPQFPCQPISLSSGRGFLPSYSSPTGLTTRTVKTEYPATDLDISARRKEVSWGCRAMVEDPSKHVQGPAVSILSSEVFKAPKSSVPLSKHSHISCVPHQRTVSTSPNQVLQLHWFSTSSDSLTVRVGHGFSIPPLSF